MAPKSTQSRELSAAEYAMLDDIGAGRVDELPLEDTGAVPRDGTAMNRIESGRTGVNNRWNQAIAGGAFEDEDAAVVAGQRELANGQLARMRRAADLSFMAVNRGFDYNDRRLRRNHNGQVAPRAQFVRGERGPADAGLAHTGDGPVELRGAMRNRRHAPQPVPVSNTSTQRPSRPSTNDQLPLVAANGPGLNQAFSSRERPPEGDRPPAQSAAVQSVSSGTREEVQVRSTTVSLELPDGHSVLFQATVTFASPTFLNRTAEYPGTIYLVAGHSSASDEIVLHIDEDRVEDVKRHTKDYVDYLSDSDRLILQFKDERDCVTWFVVVFRQRDIMVAFVDALRKLVTRLKEAPTKQDQTDMSPAMANASSAHTEPPHITAAPIIENPQYPDTTKVISVAILEDIVSWAMHIVEFIRDSGPAELANAEALPGIIRGAAAAVLMEKHAGFSGFDSKQRVAFIDDVCAPQVFERFKRRMLEDLAKKPTTAPNTQKSLEAQGITPRERRPRYTIQKLIALESTAVDPPGYLTELRYLPEMNPENRALIEQIIRQAYGRHDASSDRATPPRTLVMSPPKAECNLDGHVSPARAKKVGSQNSDAGSVHAAPALLAHAAPSVTVTAPNETADPEPLVSIYGLNSSIHNKDGADIIGQSAGQFTGALSRDKSYLADLMSIDRVEDFDVIRANDPEVAEIADRFAQVHFEHGTPT